MKAPMYRELTGRELLIYKTGFKNGFRMSLQQSKAKIEGQLLKLKLRQERFEERKWFSIGQKESLSSNFRYSS